jgi:subtilase family serine protease
VPALATLASSAGTTAGTIPAGTAAGSYYIIATADATVAVAESVETNNTRSKAVTIAP